MPGFATEDIDVHLDDERTLRVTAERDEDERFEDGTVVKRERHSERVSRTVSLPGIVDPDETEATYANGVLTVRLDKQTGDGEGTTIPVE